MILSMLFINRISGLESDFKTMAATNSQLQAKVKKRHEALEQTKGDLRKCETDNQRLEAVMSHLADSLRILCIIA